MTDKCKCSVFKKTSYFSRKIARTKCPLTCSASSCSRATLSTRTYSRPVCWCQAHQDTSLPALPTSGTPSYWLFKSPPVQRVLVSFPGSFWYLLQRLSISFTNVKISKPGELIHLAPSITLIVRFVDVKQSSFKLAMCLMSK